MMDYLDLTPPPPLKTVDINLLSKTAGNHKATLIQRLVGGGSRHGLKKYGQPALLPFP